MSRTAVAAALLLLSASGIAAEAPLAVVERIALPGVGGRIDHLVGDGRRLFLAALGADAVLVVDLAGRCVERTIAGIAAPQGLAWLPGPGRLVVAAGGGDAVEVFDAAGGRIGRIDGLAEADNVHVDAVDGLVYVGYGAGASAGIAAIDTMAVAVRRRISLPGHPEGFALAASDRRILVDVPEANAVVAVDRDSGAIAARWPLPGARGNFPLALDEAGGRVLVACRSPSRLLALALADGACRDALACPGDADDVWLDAAGGRIYVSGGAGAVAVMRSAPPIAALAEVATAPGARTSWFDAHARRLYVACPSRDGRDAEILVLAAAGP